MFSSLLKPLVSVYHLLCCRWTEVAEHESAYFHISLKIYYYSCRLLFLHHVLRTMRHVVQHDSDRRWYRHTEHNGVNIAQLWGHQALLLAEEMLSSAISRSDLEQLGSAPDIIFALLCFAAAFLAGYASMRFMKIRVHSYLAPVMLFWPR